MGEKYLGSTFDIHGGGLDLLFPHHECEIAQSVAAQKKQAVNYWMHNNMITIEGKKMGKSYNNFITLEEFFEGRHPLLSQPFSPMVIRFFILQAHYRSTVDFSNEALCAAEKALKKMLEGYRRLQVLLPAEKSNIEVPNFMALCSEAMDDDLNTPIVIAHLFDACRIINSATDGTATLSAEDLQMLKVVFKTFLEDILGIRVAQEVGDNGNMKAYSGAMDLLMEIRANAKAAKDWSTSDLIRDKLAKLGFKIKDTKNGAEWSLE
jgi:cysteinyl-tRNA synthetase